MCIRKFGLVYMKTPINLQSTPINTIYFTQKIILIEILCVMNNNTLTARGKVITLNAMKVYRSSTHSQLHGLGKSSSYSDMLWTGRSRDQNLVRVRFSVPVQTSPETQQTSCTMGTRCLSLG